jgi:Flp pilus assembly CpaF family ATPase
VVPDILEKNGGLPPMREVVNVLYTRMRPDVIVFGEVVGDEAVPLLDAMNLGKRVLTTIHGDSAYGALLRLEMLALGSGLPLPAIQERVAAGIDLVIHMARRGNHRYVSEVVMVNGHDPVSKTYDLATLYSADDGLKDQVAHLRSLWRENA